MIAVRRYTNERIGLLQDMDLFSGCNKDQLRRIDSLTMMLGVEQGTVLVEEGRAGLEFFVVVSGTAIASRQGLWLAEFGAGSFFGELALLDRGQRTATVIADTDMSLLVFSQAEFHALQWWVPSVAHKMAIELSRRLRRADELLDQESSCATSPRPVVLSGG